jgi:hypothetical protein
MSDKGGGITGLSAYTASPLLHLHVAGQTSPMHGAVAIGVTPCRAGDFVAAGRA